MKAKGEVKTQRGNEVKIDAKLAGGLVRVEYSGEHLMAFGSTAHPPSGQFTAEKRVFRVECAGVGRVG